MFPEIKEIKATIKNKIFFILHFFKLNITFVTAADYTDLDENGVPWGLTVSVDAKTYYSMEMWYSAVATVAPAVMLGRYQVLCGVSGDEWAVHVTVKDADSGKVISEHDFPTRGE